MNSDNEVYQFTKSTLHYFLMYEANPKVFQRKDTDF